MGYMKVKDPTTGRYVPLVGPDPKAYIEQRGLDFSNYEGLKRITGHYAYDNYIHDFNIDMDGKVISGPADPTAGNEVGDRDYSDARYGHRTAGGTTFPGSPSTGDVYYRTNVRGGTLFRYNGTYWLSDTEYVISSGEQEIDSTTGGYTWRTQWGNLPNDYNVYITYLQIKLHTAATVDGSNYREMYIVDDGATALINGHNTTAATWQMVASSGAGWAKSAGQGLRMYSWTTGSPGISHYNLTAYFKLRTT